MVLRSMMTHLALLVIAVVLAVRGWTAEDDPKEKHIAAELWGGVPERIDTIRFETKKKRVVLEPKKDEQGTYYVGTVEKVKAPVSRPDPHNPHAPKVEEKDLSDPTAKKETVRFIGVKEADELAQALVPMKVLRVLGHVEEARIGDFGFDADHGTLTVSISGKKHALTLGGKTPGGQDRYVRDPDSGEAYVISGKLTNQLESADSSLMERESHGFADEEVDSVKIIKGEQSRELVRNKETKGFWSSPDKPQEKDETASNWMSKLDRLRINKYVEKPEPPIKPAEDLVVRVEYLSSRKRVLGYIEVYRRPPEEGKERNSYLAKTEQSRWYATVLTSTAEQLDQDLSTLLSQ